MELLNANYFGNDFQKNDKKIFLGIQAFDNNHFDSSHQDEYYACVIILNGNGINLSDMVEYPYNAIQMYCYTPFQFYQFNTNTKSDGLIIRFHSDFFCLEKHGKELQCNGVLFNDIYGTPHFELTKSELDELQLNINALVNEIQLGGVASDEALISYLKIFMVNAVRIKLKQIHSAHILPSDYQSITIRAFEALLNTNYNLMHQPTKYASLLGVTLRTLNNYCNKVYKKSPIEIIQDKIILEVKKSLYLTNKPIKEIAFEVGFSDLQYFNRVFKKKTSLAPGEYRKSLGIFRNEIA